MTSKEARKLFVEEYGALAKQVTAGTGIFPETLLAMAIIESSGRVGNSYLPGKSVLTIKANNFFGIKADGTWKGKILEIRTKEYTKERGFYYEVAKFRKYDTAADGFKDYVNFLQKNKRYLKAGVFTAPDYVTQISRIAKVMPRRQTMQK
jgi:mannosyl-glycoprotein endo-beta-N-acetylglucosaminidase/stage II sporulation protein P